ncbi:MAG: hypothetical protein R3Y32_06985 [Bacillota bacterium]
MLNGFKTGLVIFISIILAIVCEVVSKSYAFLYFEQSHYNNIMIALFSGLIVLGLFGGTVIQIASNGTLNMFGYKSNFIVYDIPMALKFFSLSH